jgi:hypothetical protein
MSRKTTMTPIQARMKKSTESNQIKKIMKKTKMKMITMTKKRKKM